MEIYWSSASIGVALGGFIFPQVMMETVREYIREEVQQSKRESKGETVYLDSQLTDLLGN